MRTGSCSHKLMDGKGLFDLTDGKRLFVKFLIFFSAICFQVE